MMDHSDDSSSTKGYPDDDLGLAALGQQIAGDHIDNLAQEARLTERIFGKAAEPVRLGRWILRNPLGHGASGSVHAADDPELERTVALKILRPRPDIDSEMARLRLRREAKALARLPHHPNVIGIFDAISDGDEVYLVMEYIEGGSLRQWQGEQRRLDQILDTYLQAARGLACIHATGLVHRDFKPENVLVEPKGRVVVIDLGLVHAVNEGRAPSERPDEMRDSELDHCITRTGTRLGTVAYMAPEQLAGDHTDARSDQFAFCVSLYEAICGEHPFSGKNIDYAERLEIILRGELRPARMPPWLARVLRRGLSARREDRYPDMNSLAHAIERGRRKRWPRIAAGMGAAILAGVLLFMAIRPVPPSDCPTEAEQAASSFWNQRQKAQLGAHLLAAGLGEQAWLELEEVFEARARTWRGAYVKTCEDRSIARTARAQELAELRSACLIAEQEELRFWIDRLAGAPEAGQGTASSAMVLDMAQKATEDMLRHRGCLHPESARLAVEPPADPDDRATARRLRTELEEVESLELAGQLQKAVQAARHVVEEAERLGYVPVRVEALHRLGHVLGTMDDYEKAEEVLRQAAELAAEHRLFGEELDVLSFLLKLAADGHQEPERARAWLSETRRALLRSHDVTGQTMRQVEKKPDGQASIAPETIDARYRLAEYLEARGMLADLEGKYDEAIVLHGRALDIRTGLPGGGWLESKSLNNLGNALANRALAVGGSYDEALDQYTKGLELRRELYGSAHPMVAQMHYSIGRVVGYNRGEFERGRRELERALAIQRESFGADDPRLLLTLLALTYNEYASGKLDRAEELTTQISAIHARLREAGDPVARRLDRTQEHKIVAAVHEQRGRLAEALAEVKRAIEIFEEHQVQKTRSQQSYLYVWSLHDAGNLEGQMKRWQQARLLLEKALIMYECCSRPDPDLEASIRAELAGALRALGSHSGHARMLERAGSTQLPD